jgi:hypothetical protein
MIKLSPNSLTQVLLFLDISSVLRCRLLSKTLKAKVEVGLWSLKQNAQTDIDRFLVAPANVTKDEEFKVKAAQVVYNPDDGIPYVRMTTPGQAKAYYYPPHQVKLLFTLGAHVSLRRNTLDLDWDQCKATLLQADFYERLVSADDSYWRSTSLKEYLHNVLKDPSGTRELCARNRVAFMIYEVVLYFQEKISRMEDPACAPAFKLKSVLLKLERLKTDPALAASLKTKQSSKKPGKTTALRRRG